jgi:hypothetical protein
LRTLLTAAMPDSALERRAQRRARTCQEIAMTIRKITACFACVLLFAAFVPEDEQRVYVPKPVRTIRVTGKPADPRAPFEPTYEHSWHDPQREQDRKNNPLWHQPVWRPTRTPVLPPPEFDYAFKGEMGITVHRGNKTEIQVACGDPNLKRGDILGCAYRSHNGDRCTVYILYDEILEAYDLGFDTVFRHEQGHCNSWVHERPKPLIEFPR